MRGAQFAGLLSILAGLALWEFLSRVVVANALFLAAPSQIFAAIYGLAVSGELWPHIGISAAEFALGYAIASLLGIATGLAMAQSEVAKNVLQPWISGLYATPTIALAPLFILWLGIGIWSKVLVVVFLVLFPVTINTEAGLRTTSPRLIEMLRSFGATPRQIFFKLALPSAMPFILAGLKLGIGRGLIGSPETLRRRLRRFETSHIDQVILLNQAGKNTHEHICESLELFAKEVMPEFHAHEPAQQAWKRQVLAREIELEEIDTAPFRDRYGPNSVQVTRAQAAE